MAIKEPININALINQSGCFDLQFRKDTKHKRYKSPTYYHWKAQFVIIKPPEKIRNILKCGNIHTTQEQARYSVQNIDEIKNAIIPYFQKLRLSGRKKKDFELWTNAVDILYKNKGKLLSSWKKNDFDAGDYW